VSTLFWSVMIPTYDPKPHDLEQMLASVLSQDRGSGTMQIEVTDDCSPTVDVKQIVRAVAGDRVQFSQTHVNLGLSGCWNECIERARGEWVHILHQDDYVLPGFYSEVEKLAGLHPDVGLIASRSFFVDGEGVIYGLTPRIRSLEQGGRTVEEFLYDNPIQFPGVVAQKKAYERLGDFRADLSYTVDWEMWTRIIDQAGGVVSPQVLACYRTTDQNASSRLARTGETLTDRAKLNRIFAERYRTFDAKTANLRVCEFALSRAEIFKMSDDNRAVQVHLKYWKKNAPLTAKVRRYGGVIYRILQDAFSKLRKGVVV
jgi:glycosyltransferase involved in cell wall biosynthesis